MESFGIISTLHHRTGSRETIRGLEGGRGGGSDTCWLLADRVFPFRLSKMVNRRKWSKRGPGGRERGKMEG